MDICRIALHLTLAETQHGFCANKSNTMSLPMLDQQAVTGFNRRCPPRRSVVMAVEFSKAFDTVDRVVLLSCLLDSTMDSNSIR